MLAGAEQVVISYTPETSPETFNLPGSPLPKNVYVCGGELISDGRAFDGPVKIYRRR